jgi:hypothetical protein
MFLLFDISISFLIRNSIAGTKYSFELVKYNMMGTVITDNFTYFAELCHSDPWNPDHTFMKMLDKDPHCRAMPI